jgi:hypothetical protein
LREAKGTRDAAGLAGPGATSAGSKALLGGGAPAREIASPSRPGTSGGEQGTASAMGNWSGDAQVTAAAEGSRISGEQQHRGGISYWMRGR